MYLSVLTRFKISKKKLNIKQNIMASLGSFMSVLNFLLFLFVGLISSSEAAIKKYQFDVSYYILIIFSMP